MFYDQLIYLCDKTGEKPTPLMKKLGLSPGNLGRWQKGASVNSDILEQLSIHFKVSVDFLLTGKEKSSSTDLTEDEQELLTYYKELDVKYKERVLERAEALAEVLVEQRREREAAMTSPKCAAIMSSEDNEYIYLDFPALPVSAGCGVYLDIDDYQQIKVKASDVPINTNYVLRISGDSMEPQFSDNDIVFVRSQPCVDIGDIGIFIYNGNAYIKQFGGDRLVSLNDKYDDIVITEPDSFFVKGKVIGIL